MCDRGEVGLILIPQEYVWKTGAIQIILTIDDVLSCHLDKIIPHSGSYPHANGIRGSQMHACVLGEQSR